MNTDTGKQFLSSFWSFVDTETYPENARSFDTLLSCGNRRIFRTQRRFLGLGPSSLQPGDIVAVLHGGRVPFVLRLGGAGECAFRACGSVLRVFDYGLTGVRYA